MPVPRGVRGKRIGVLPRFVEPYPDLREKVTLPLQVSAKGRGELHECNRTDDESLGKVGIEQVRGAGSEIRIVLEHVEQEAGVDDPGQSPSLAGPKLPHPGSRPARAAKLLRVAEHGDGSDGPHCRVLLRRSKTRDGTPPARDENRLPGALDLVHELEAMGFELRHRNGHND